MDRLQQKAYRTYNYISRYSSFPYYYNTEDEKYIYGTTAYLDDSTPYTLYKVQKADTWDSMALKFYNSPTFFWILCDFNRIRDPFIKLKEGQQIKVPVITSIRYKLFVFQL